MTWAPCPSSATPSAATTTARPASPSNSNSCKSTCDLSRCSMISDRGTYSAAHVARLDRAGHHVLCSVPWRDFKPLFHEHRDRLFWNQASFLSVEQKRRRQGNSALPKERYELAVLRHQLIDPDSGDDRSVPRPLRLQQRRSKGLPARSVNGPSRKSAPASNTSPNRLPAAITVPRSPRTSTAASPNCSASAAPPVTSAGSSAAHGRRAGCLAAAVTRLSPAHAPLRLPLR